MWPLNYLIRLDQYFAGFKGHHWAFIGALVVVLAATYALGAFNPKNQIRDRLKGDYFSTDMTFGYAVNDLYAMLDKYRRGPGEDFDRHKRFLCLDLIYPLVYSIAAAIMLGYLLPVVAPDNHARMHYLTLVPFAAALFDLLENFSMYFVVRAYAGERPERLEGLAKFSSVMTAFKMLLIGAVLSVVLIAAVVGFIKLLSLLFRRKPLPSSDSTT